MTTAESRLIVSKQNPHQLETVDGNPFMPIGDTAWELFHRLTFEETEQYLNVRANQGFNMVWANLLAEFDGITTPNRNGDLPFHDLDPLRPNESYFQYVDKVISLAASLGIYLGLLPTWGDKITAPWGAGPVVFTLDNLEVAEGYGAFLGARCRDVPNLIWVLGGDRPAKLFGEADKFPKVSAIEAGIETDTDWTPIWRALARGIKAGGSLHLMTYHPQGGVMSTSQLLHDEDWLDINAIQSGHGGGHDVPVWESISRDYSMLPIKPTFDCEPNYEDHAVSPWPSWDPANGFFDDYDVRKQVYRSIFAGGCGVIYGHHSVWQFASELHEPVLMPQMNWHEALFRPGSVQMGHLASLLASVDFPSFSPDQSLLICDEGDGASHKRAMRSDSVALVYLPIKEQVALSTQWATGKTLSVERFDPLSGKRSTVDADSGSSHILVSPSSLLPSEDSVLILTAK